MGISLRARRCGMISRSPRPTATATSSREPRRPQDRWPRREAASSHTRPHALGRGWYGNRDADNDRWRRQMEADSDRWRTGQTETKDTETEATADAARSRDGPDMTGSRQQFQDRRPTAKRDGEEGRRRRTAKKDGEEGGEAGGEEGWRSTGAAEDEARRRRRRHDWIRGKGGRDLRRWRLLPPPPLLFLPLFLLLLQLPPPILLLPPPSTPPSTSAAPICFPFCSCSSFRCSSHSTCFDGGERPPRHAERRRRRCSQTTSGSTPTSGALLGAPAAAGHQREHPD